MKGYLILLGFLGVVPAILSLLQPVDHKYYLIMTKATWPDAQNYCRKTYADLATVESELDWLRLNTTAASEGLTDVAWIGLYSGWRWSFNDIPLKDTFKKWTNSSGQPDNLGGDQSCVASAKVSSAPRYVGVTATLTWSGAQAYCQKFYTDLAITFASTDNDATQSIAKQQGVSWIDLYRDIWKWSDGTDTSNLLWFPGPPNVNGKENCAVFNKGTFENATCTDRHYFICHISSTAHPVRKNQIIQLQVKSDVNMIDSYVQANILELVKQKLDEYGMLDNTTVTWRVQSDGEIFHKKKKRSLDATIVQANKY